MKIKDFKKLVSLLPNDIEVNVMLEPNDNTKVDLSSIYLYSIEEHADMFLNLLLGSKYEDVNPDNEDCKLIIIDTDEIVNVFKLYLKNYNILD